MEPFQSSVTHLKVVPLTTRRYVFAVNPSSPVPAEHPAGTGLVPEAILLQG